MVKFILSLQKLTHLIQYNRSMEVMVCRVVDDPNVGLYELGVTAG